MEIDIYWTDFAKRELRQIFEYHNDNVSLKVAQKISTQIVIDTNKLKNFPEMGAIEELLSNRPQEFRYIVSTNYKIIYWINQDKSRIEIIDVFDTRQNPIKMERNK